jgi:bifunctional DNase/RNase
VKLLEIVGVRLEVPSNQPVVLLRETDSSRFLPIWIGTPEATAIALAQEGVVPPRPQTHDLIVNLLEALGDSVTEVHITGVEDGVFYATLVLRSGLEVGARPSDAIAIALRSNAPVLASESLLAEAAVEIAQESASGVEADESQTPEDAEQELQKFREFLAEVNPEDFDGPEIPPSGPLS